MPKKKGCTKVEQDPIKMEEQGACGGGSGQTFINVTNVTNSTGVQIGSGNSLSCTESGSLSSQGLSKKQVGLLIVRNIMTNRGDTVPLDELRSSVKDALNVLDEKTTFIKHVGLPLEEFLIFNRDEFDIKKQKGQKIVYLKRKRSKGRQMKKCEMKAANEEKQIASEIERIPHQICTGSHTTDVKQENKIQIVNKTNDSDTFMMNKYENETDKDQDMWVEVKPKRKHKTKVKDTEAKGDNNTSPRDDIFHPLYDRFRQMISEDTHNLFIPCHEVYRDNKLKCCIDIVSMWNTPHRLVSYIIIGVTKNSNRQCILDGVDDSFDDVYFYDTLFENAPFDGKPLFQYHRLQYDSKLFGIIEIKSSFGHCKPIFVVQTLSCQGVEVKEKQLWSMKKSDRVVLSPSDYSPIFMWFHGTNQTKLIHDSSENKCQKESPVREIGDSTDRKQKPMYGKSYTQLWEKTNGFKTGHYVLLTGDIPRTVKNIRNLALIPWIAVYDFDIQSTFCGALNAMQDDIETARHLRIGTWQDNVPEMTESGTWWCFMRGRKEFHESRTDICLDTDRQKDVERSHQWFRTVKQSIAENGEAVATFSEDCTPLTFVMLWPMNKGMLPLMTKFLEGITDSLSYRPQIILCIHKADITDKGRARIDTLSDDFGENMYVSILDFESMCQGMANDIAKAKERKQKYSLPKADNYECEPIKKKDALWLSEDLEVLYLQNTYPEKETEAIDRELTNFYKGGSLHWPLWYLKGEGSVEIDRDILKCMEETTKVHLENYRTSVITLYHNPGAGGSTLAKRVLWRFHRKVPCVHAKAETKSHSKDLSSKIAFIHEKTHLPVLVLIDGEDESKVRYLKAVLKYSVIIYVKRHPYNIQNQREADNVYLKGLVSPAEAGKLTEKIGERCEDNKRNALVRLCSDVKQNKQHNLYEFGMTAFCHEFKGTASYVEGYLQLRDNPTKDLLPWQRCLGYLSLVYYYGQLSIPCQFFARLFGKPAQYAMSLDEDFPYPMKEFIVADPDETRKNDIRICHFLIAKEVLEQLLTRQRNVEEQCSDTLSLNAKRNLAVFCKEFIEYTSSKRLSSPSTLARYILTRTFIFRDAKDMGENEEQIRRRPVLSKIIIDIPAGKPLFTERLRVLEKLSDSFPNDPNFLAHLGRFYAFCRPNEEEQAEVYFKKALQLCDSQNKGKHYDQLSDSMRASLMHIYHMYGIVKHRSIKKRISQYQSEKTQTWMPVVKVKELIDIAEPACEYFKRSRDITPDTKDAYTYAYTGEIELRINICDFIKKHFGTGSQQSFSQFFASEVDKDTKSFVAKSIPAIEVLILECYKDVELSEDDLHSLRRLVNWYKELFKTEKFTDMSDLGLDAVSTKRIEIIEKKKGFGSKWTLTGPEHVHDEGTIKAIVSLYEQIFKEVRRTGLIGGKRSLRDLDHDYREWVLAIRHESLGKPYLLEDVLTHVQTWYDLIKSPLATFYVFVLKSLLGFGADGKSGKTECLIDAKIIQEEMTKNARLLLRPKYPREWLGSSGEGITVLISGNKYVGMGPEERDTPRTGLAVCKGTICAPNKNPVGGYIAYDVGAATVKVFYIPIRVDLIGNRHAGKRVEFSLAFSVERGYEAFNVKLLKRYGCSECEKKVEFRSVDDQVICMCGEIIYKDSLNEVSDCSSDA